MWTRRPANCGLIECYSADHGNLLRFYNIAASAGRRERLRRFYTETRVTLAEKKPDKLSRDGKIDYVP